MVLIDKGADAKQKPETKSCILTFVCNTKI